MEVRIITLFEEQLTELSIWLQCGIFITFNFKHITFGIQKIYRKLGEIENAHTWYTRVRLFCYLLLNCATLIATCHLLIKIKIKLFRPKNCKGPARNWSNWQLAFIRACTLLLTSHRAFAYDIYTSMLVFVSCMPHRFCFNVQHSVLLLLLFDFFI